MGENQGIQVIGPVPGDIVDTDPGLYQVQTREAWGDDWVTAPYLRPIKGKQSVAPKISEAQFLWEYGKIMEPDQSAFAARDPQDLLGVFVRVNLVSANGVQPIWYGRFEDDSVEVHGATTYPQGNQTLMAKGLEAELDRYRLAVAKCRQGGATIEQETMPEFNRRSKIGPGLIGNRSTAVHTDDVYEFSDDGEVWDNRAIAQSILAWNLPATAPPFQLGGQDDQVALLKKVQKLPNTMTLRQALNILIDPRRGLGWMVRVDDEDNVVIWVYSVMDEAISIGSYVVAANREIFTVVLDDAQNIDKALVTSHRSSKFDRVIAQGAPSKGIFSIAFADATWEEGFTAGLLTAFKAGASGDPNYAALGSDTLSKGSWNEKVRGDDRFERMGHFRIPQDWDGYAGDGEGGDQFVALPSVGDDGEVDVNTPQTIFLLGKSFLKNLPGMLVGKNYSVWPPTDENPADGDPEYRKPFVLIKDESRWAFIDKLSERATKANMPAATVRMVDRELAIAVEIKPRFVLFANHWSGAEPGLVGGNVVTASQGASTLLAYEDMIATVAMEGDQHVKIVAGGGEGDDDGRELVVEVPDAELVYLAPGTVVGVDDNGNLIRASGGTFILDDRERLKAVAALSWGWYRKPRATVELAVSSRFPLIGCGQLMQGARSASDYREVGTVVTEIAYDWKAGTTEYRTMYSEMDFAGYAPDFPDNRTVSRELVHLRKQVQDLNERTAGIPSRIGAAVVMAATAFIAAGGYAEAVAATPTVVKSSNTDPATVNWYTESNSYGTESNVRKAVIKLERAFKASGAHLILVSPSQPYVNANYGSAGNRSIVNSVLAWPILDDFDLDVDTSWNGLLGLLTGTPSANSRNFYVGTSNGDNVQIPDLGVNAVYTMQIYLEGLDSTANIYGFIIGIKPHGGSGAPSSVSSYLRLNSYTDGGVIVIPDA